MRDLVAVDWDPFANEDALSLQGKGVTLKQVQESRIYNQQNISRKERQTVAEKEVLAAATITLRDKRKRFADLDSLQAFFKAQWITFPDAGDRARLKAAYDLRKAELEA